MATTTEQAQQIFTDYQQQVEMVRSNKALSREGQRAQLAQLYLAARERMDVVFERESGQQDTRRRYLESSLFGISSLRGDAASLSISRRDAVDRVEKVENTDQAIALLARASTGGDEVLARVIAQWGYERTPMW
jgi:hypothetical protein